MVIVEPWRILWYPDVIEVALSRSSAIYIIQDKPDFNYNCINSRASVALNRWFKYSVCFDQIFWYIKHTAKNMLNFRLIQNLISISNSFQIQLSKEFMLTYTFFYLAIIFSFTMMSSLIGDQERIETYFQI